MAGNLLTARWPSLPLRWGGPSAVRYAATTLRVLPGVDGLCPWTSPVSLRPHIRIAPAPSSLGCFACPRTIDPAWASRPLCMMGCGPKWRSAIDGSSAWGPWPVTGPASSALGACASWRTSVSLTQATVELIHQRRSPAGPRPRCSRQALVTGRQVICSEHTPSASPGTPGLDPHGFRPQALATALHQGAPDGQLCAFGLVVQRSQRHRQIAR